LKTTAVHKPVAVFMRVCAQFVCLLRGQAQICDKHFVKFVIAVIS